MNSRFIRILCIAFAGFALSGAKPAFAQIQQFYPDSYLEDDFQNWDVVTLTAPLSPQGKVLGYLEAQPRFGNDTRDFTALIIRPAVGYQLNKQVSVWQGYAWAPAFSPAFRNENRIFQQLLVENEFKRFKLTNRTRLEQRWIQDSHGTSVRARHLARISIPFGKSKKWAYVLYDEMMVNLNTVPNGPVAGFDQNRAFAGINRKLNKHVNAEVGYMGNIVNRRYGVVDRWNHIVLVQVNFKTR